jgi:hypothetical protein
VTGAPLTGPEFAEALRGDVVVAQQEVAETARPERGDRVDRGLFLVRVDRAGRAAAESRA